MYQWQARNKREKSEMQLPYMSQFCLQRQWGGCFHRATTVVVQPGMLDDTISSIMGHTYQGK
jgi:hypothetical protein